VPNTPTPVAELLKRGILAINDGYRAKNEELSKSGLPFARAQNINHGFHFDDADCMPLDAVAKIGNKVSQPGDVVFTSKGTVGRFALVRNDTPRFVYAPQLCFWRSLNPDVLNSRWLYYWMHSREFYEQYKSVAGQTDMAEYVSLSDQRRMRISLPPLPEQRAIAGVLGALDDKIEVNRKQARVLEEIARAVFKSWFVDFDPVRRKAAGQPTGLPPDLDALFPSRLTDSPIGPVPEGWKVGTLGELLSLSRDTIDPGQQPSEEFDHFSIPAFDAGQMPSTDRGATIKSQKFVVTAECVLVSKLNPRTPRVWLPPPAASRRQVASTEFLVCTGNKAAQVSREFVYCMATSEPLVEHLTTHASGTSNSHQRVRPQDFLGFQCVQPPGDVLRAFTHAASPILKRTAASRAESATLAALRDTLLPKLISGDLRIADAEKIVGRAM